MNTNLSQLVTSMNSMLTSGGIGYIGQTIEAKGDTTTLQDGSASWGYSLSSPPPRCRWRARGCSATRSTT
jgi:flagellar basal-body rod modification protein FlgD